MPLNVTTVHFEPGQRKATAERLVQWDHGQILRIEGLELPNVFEVHFSNSKTEGKAKPQLGENGDVEIPGQYLKTGDKIYAWIYLHEGAEDGATKYFITIPIDRRPDPDDTPPDPEEESVIAQLITAMNNAVEQTTGDAEQAGSSAASANASARQTLEYMYTAQAIASEAAGSASSAAGSATNAEGSATTAEEKAGEAAASAAAAATSAGAASSSAGRAENAATHYPKIEGGTWRVWNVNTGTWVDTGVEAQGPPGEGATVDNALSPTSENPVQNKVIDSELSDVKADLSELSSSIAPVESSATATAAHAIGELFMMGETLMVALSAIAIGDTITTEGGSPNAAVTKLSDKLIKDVQINGSSILNNGVANVPIANANAPGVVQVSGRGLWVTNNNILACAFASGSEVRAGTGQDVQLMPSRQHESTFYGLAKAAGSDEKNNTNVGQYTDAAKIAIQKMLGIYEAPWELIREDTVTNATEADVEITVDGNGQPFELNDVILQYDTPVQETAASKASSQIYLYHGAGSSNRFMAEAGSWTQAAGTTAHGAFVSFTQDGNLILLGVKVQSTGGNNGGYGYRYSAAEKSSGVYYNTTGNLLNIIRAVIPGVTGTMHYRLLGKRKWS